MLFTFYLLLPTAICLFWVVVHAIVASRTDTFRLFAALFTFCGVYIFSEACHALVDQSSAMNTIATLIGQLAGPCIVPMYIAYIHRLLYPNKRDNPLSYTWVIIPAVLFTAGVLLYIMRGSSRADELFVLFTEKVYHVVLAIELAILVMTFISFMVRRKPVPGKFFKFLFKGEEISLVRLQAINGGITMVIMIARVGYSQNLYSLSLWVVITVVTLLSLASFFFGLFALLGEKSSIRLSELTRITRYNYSSKDKADVVEEMLNDLLDEAEGEALKRIQDKIGENLHIEEFKAGDLRGDDAPQLTNRIFNAVADSWDEGSLTSRFQHIMLEEQLFLQPRLTLEDVAERLGTSKTYVSKMVNNTYNLGFPELINTLRVDYAEQYILSHREAKQEQIAAHCGFLSASSFNTTFKKVTGMTPKVWIASMDRQNGK